MVKEQYRESGLGHRISHVCFGMQSAQEVERAAHLQVNSRKCQHEEIHETVFN